MDRGNGPTLGANIRVSDYSQRLRDMDVIILIANLVIIVIKTGSVHGFDKFLFGVWESGE